MCRNPDTNSMSRRRGRAGNGICRAGVTAFPHVVTPAHHPHTRRWNGRTWTTALLMVLTMLGLGVPAAMAEPQDAESIPENLRGYVVDTAQWNASEWMRSEGCVDRGGDFAVYARNVVDDTPELLQFFQPDFAGVDAAAPARGQTILDGYRTIAENISVPTGYCVNDVKRWAATDPNFKPFGFRWGDSPKADAAAGHSTTYRCTNTQGADNAACGGFYIGCDGATTQQDHQRCQEWNDFSDDYVRQVQEARTAALDRNPATGQSPVHTEVKSPSEIAQDVLDWAVKSGMDQVVSFVISGVVKLWGTFTSIVVDYGSPDLAGGEFTAVYNLVAGIAIAVAFLGWLATLATSWKQGRLQVSLLGGIKAAVGVTLAGVGAILMLQLADECTKGLLAAGGDLANQADFTQSLAKTNPLVALIVGIIIAALLIFTIIFLVLHGALVLMWALMGSIAAAGQVHSASAGWLSKWAGRLTALVWSKFAMVAVMLLAQSLLLPIDTGENLGRQIVDVVQGLALSAMLIATPALLWELVDFASDRVGGAAASGGPAAGIASARTSGAVTGAGSAAASGIGSAVSTMRTASADLLSKFAGGSTGGGGSGPGSGGGMAKPPRTEAGSLGGNGDGATSTPSAARTTPTASADTNSASGTGSGGTGGRQSPGVANRGRVVAGPVSGAGGSAGQISGWANGSGDGGPSRSGGRGAPKVPPP